MAKVTVIRDSGIQNMSSIRDMSPIIANESKFEENVKQIFNFLLIESGRYRVSDMQKTSRQI